MPAGIVKVKVGEGIEALQRLLQQVTLRENCRAGVARCEGTNPTAQAEWVIDLAHANAKINDLLPTAFAFLVDLKREVGR